MAESPEPTHAPVEVDHDLVIIGAGPGGYVAAIRAAQLGLNVGIIDPNPQLGGTCLRVGCIPSKALLESSHQLEQVQQLGAHGITVGEVSFDLGAMLKRKDKVVQVLSKGIEGLFRKHGITWYRGYGKLAAPGRVAIETDEGRRAVQAKHIVLATGSVPADLPGVERDGQRIGSSTEALAFDTVPDHLVVIGAGYIGLELGSVWRRLGARVTVLEYLDRILPGLDADVALEALRLFKRQGLDFHLNTRVTAARREGDGCVVERDGAEPIRCDRVLLAVGRRPFTDGLGLDELGVERDPRGFITVDEHFQTNVPGVYAIGDVIPGPMLAHVAEEEGIACVEGLAGGWGHVDYDVIPAVVFTHPEIASVGRTEEQLQADEVAYRVGVFPFLANGRARTLEDTAGKVKVLADAETDRVLGVHIIGPEAGNLIAEATAAMAFGASSEDIARTCHAHPTLPEALKEAALAVDERPIHL